jgi:hypothetical protein
MLPVSFHDYYKKLGKIGRLDWRKIERREAALLARPVMAQKDLCEAIAMIRFPQLRFLGRHKGDGILL